MSAPGSVAWFAHHEFRLMWRDWIAMMTAGRRARTLVVALAIFAVVMHGVAFMVVGGYATLATPDTTALVVITGSVLLAWSLMLSQAMESVTRAFYARSDLDLILSSPTVATRLFAVRIVAIAVSVTAMAMLIAAPFVDVLVIAGGLHWLGAFGAVAAVGAMAAAVAVLATAAMFAVIGPKRTRLVAQIVAAVIGAVFVIALQLAAIVSSGTLSRFAALASQPVAAIAPDAGSALWLPARAMLGDPAALIGLAALGLVLLAASVALTAPRFAAYALATAGQSQGSVRQRRTFIFRVASPLALLRRKEWTLLWRDPWLASQTLMQLLYLLPPAFFLWRSFGDGPGVAVLLVPVLVMAAGQLGGGLAWLAISGEDAPELIATAPLAAGRILRAKVEAVMGAVIMMFLPLILALAIVSSFSAIVAAAGIAAAAASATYVQLCFRAQARRSQFRRRQTSSRIATFIEAFASIGCAGTAALAAAGYWGAAAPALLTVGLLAGARAVRPHKA